MSGNRCDDSESLKKDFSNMSTEELEDLIGDLLLDNDANYELVNELLEAYEKREGVPNIDVDAAWERFKQDYSGQGEIYLTEDADNFIQAESHEVTHGKPSRRRRLLRYGLVAAAILAFIILPIAGVNTYAYGLSALQSFVQWTKETFWFDALETPTQINPELVSLHDALKEFGINELLAPTWIPEGFSIYDFSVSDTPAQIFITSSFRYSAKSLIIQIVSLSDSSLSFYEKSGEDVSIYRRNGIDHHIIINEEKISVVWMSENNKCYITGDITKDEIKKIIDSIYER